MEIGKERTDISSFLIMGAEFVESDWHKGEIIVERHGLVRPKYDFLHNGKSIATLTWRHKRVAIYEAKGIKLELLVGPMGKKIYAKDEFSNLSRLIIKSPLNARKAKMLIQLADSDGFTVKQYCENAVCNVFSLHVIKEHYITELVNFEFSLEKKRSRTIARIHVPAIMRWEAKHFHHLLALVMGRITYVQGHSSLDNHNNFLRERVLVNKRA